MGVAGQRLERQLPDELRDLQERLLHGRNLRLQREPDHWVRGDRGRRFERDGGDERGLSRQHELELRDRLQVHAQRVQGQVHRVHHVAHTLYGNRHRDRAVRYPIRRSEKYNNTKFGKSKMQNHYAVHVDNKGYVLIPIELRRAMGIEPKSLLILTQEGDELRLVPGEVVPKRKLRKVPREELAQALIDGA